MCESHSSHIDDPASLSAYPPERLREWKVAQLKDFDAVQTGWALGNSAAEIVRGVQRAPILISHSHLDLGGRGGNAPGAGGGGGAAIGADAKGGDGGKGGNTIIDEGPFTLPSDGKIISRGSYPAILGRRSPGSGGGGAGAVGPNAVAGDGGDGGDCVVSLIDIEALNLAGFSGTAQVDIGEAGRGGRLPGELATDGGITSLRFLHRDGFVLKEIKVKGGASPGPKLPDGIRELVERDLAGGLQVTTLMPVNGAELREGLVFVLGGDWRWIHVPVLPSDLVVHVLCLLRWRPLQIEAQGVGFHLFLVAPSGKRIAQQPLSIPPDFPNEGAIQFLTTIGANANEIGEYSLQVISGDFLLSETFIRVVLQP